MRVPKTYKGLIAFDKRMAKLSLKDPQRAVGQLRWMLAEVFARKQHADIAFNTLAKYVKKDEATTRLHKAD